MPRKKRQRRTGQTPPKAGGTAQPLPPSIDASPETIANVVLNAGRPRRPVSGKPYYCVECKRQVSYPETLYQDGRCEKCHREDTAID